MSICLIRWRCWLMQFRAFAALFGFLFVFEAAFGFFKAHARVHLKEVLEIVLKSSGIPSPWAKPCSSGMFPPREGDDNRIPAPCDDDAGD